LLSAGKLGKRRVGWRSTAGVDGTTELSEKIVDETCSSVTVDYH